MLIDVSIRYLDCLVTFKDGKSCDHAVLNLESLIDYYILQVVFSKVAINKSENSI